MQNNQLKITYKADSDVLEVLLTDQLYYVRYVTATIHECRTIQHNDVCGWRVFGIQKAIEDGKKPVPEDFVQKMNEMTVTELMQCVAANRYVPMPLFRAGRNELIVVTEDVPICGSYVNEAFMLFKKEGGELIGFELKCDGIIQTS